MQRHEPDQQRPRPRRPGRLGRSRPPTGPATSATAAPGSVAGPGSITGTVQRPRSTSPASTTAAGQHRLRASSRRSRSARPPLSRATGSATRIGASRPAGRRMPRRPRVLRRVAHHRQRAVPQFSPAPKPEVRSRSPRLDLAVLDQLVEGDRDRAGRGVAVPLEVLEDGVAVEPEDVAGGVDDPDVGLVRDEPADVVDLARRPGPGRRASSRSGSGRPT